MTEDWLQLQRKYWEQWTDLNRKALGADAPIANAWEGALDHWWKALSAGATDPSRQFMDRLLEQGKMFVRMADAFGRDLSAQGAAGTDAWSGFSRSLEDMQKAFTSGWQEGDDALHRMLAFWELPYDNWQRMMSSLSPIPGDMLRNMPHDQVKDSLQRLLSAPGLGYAREEQSQYQELLRRTLGYQKAQQRYYGFFSQIGVKSVERMRSVLEGLSKEGKTIDSVRGLYDTWVTCCEEVYGEEVSTPEYARVHGELVNAQMALKKAMSVTVDETLGALNMPTRSEMRTLQERLQEARRENKALRREMESIKKQLAEPAAPAPSAPAARKKTPARKKTAAKSA